MSFRNICLELSDLLYKLGRGTNDLRWKRYFVEEARKIAEKEIVEMDIEFRNLAFTAQKMARELVRKDAEIERLNHILRVSFSPLASTEIREGGHDA